MSEKRFEQWLRRHAASYNAPPETPGAEIWAEVDALRAYNRPPQTPRDEMWAGIAAARPEPETGAAVLPLHRRTAAGRWLARHGRLLALAAMLVVGIGLGRVTLVTDQRASPEPDPRAEAEARVTAEGAEGTEPLADVGSAEIDAAAGTGVVESSGERLAAVEAGGAGEGPARDPVAERPVPETLNPTIPDDAGSTDRSGTAYRLVALHTLSRAEALLTSFRSEPVDSAAVERNAQIAAWADELLTVTRLLMDSPAAQDPAMDVLLNDLELVLVQMVWLGTGGDGENADLVRDALRQRNMLPRLRDAVPAGQASIGT